MRTLVFDIETVGDEWDTLEQTTQQSLTRWIDRTVHSEVEYTARLEDLKQGLGFSPLTGRIVSVAVFDLERQQGAVYYCGHDDATDETEGDFIYKARDEYTLLKDFWDGAATYNLFVTFNGRCFDVPFLVHRSLVHQITPSQNLLNRRYLSQQRVPYHVDLQDELTFYGAMQRRPNLHMFCRAYGITSPKGDVTGDDVAVMFRREQYRDIARYNARDVVATTQLYKRWQQHLAPKTLRCA